jgi:hypothetical protein
MDKRECEQIAGYCDIMGKFLEDNLILSLCDDLETTQQFEINFIKNGVDPELDAKKQLLLESTNKLDAIRNYFNENIIKYEKKSKSSITNTTNTKTSAKNTDYVKLHETEKNSFSLVATKRRCNNLKEIVNKNTNKVIFLVKMV